MYLFSFFRDNGQDGLYLAASQDGLTWRALNDDKPLLAPKVGEKLMRDPSVCRGPDGVFHMAWTTSWEERGIGLAHSRDLVNWSEQVFLPVMEHEPATRNSWAPEIFFDDIEKQYLIFWSSTIPGRFATPDTPDEIKYGNHRIYCTTTRDFKTYTPTSLFYDNGFNVIDASMVKDGSRYVMFLKDERQVPEVRKNIRLAFADTPTGPWSPATPSFTQDWVEGPTAIRIGELWFLYVDAYAAGHYICLRSPDLQTWEDITPQLRFPPGVRHGMIFEAPDDLSILRK